MKRVIQILDTFTYGDAIGNHTIAIHNHLQSKGVESYIYASSIDARLKTYAFNISEYHSAPDDVILYHLSTGSVLNRKLAEFEGKKIINYHNITPPTYFEDYNRYFAAVCRSGYDDISFLADKVDAVISDSDYNGRELVKMGYSCPIYTVPILMNFSDYDIKPNPLILDKFNNDSVTNILFVGRIAPNKKQEDIIKDFFYYHNYFNKNSRLILVGNYTNLEMYYLKLKKYAEKLGVSNNVVFTGHIRFDEILAYYHSADLLLCESEHEGFCVPLVEAMYFDLPIVAYNSSAIGETLGDAGVLLEEKNAVLTATIIDNVLRSEKEKKKISHSQKERLEYFMSEDHLRKLIRILEDVYKKDDSI